MASEAAWDRTEGPELPQRSPLPHLNHNTSLRWTETFCPSALFSSTDFNMPTATKVCSQFNTDATPVLTSCFVFHCTWLISCWTVANVPSERTALSAFQAAQGSDAGGKAQELVGWEGWTGENQLEMTERGSNLPQNVIRCCCKNH